MALVLGDVVLNPDGTHVSTGLVGAMFDMFLAFPWMAPARGDVAQQATLLTMIRPTAALWIDTIKSADVAVTVVVSAGGLQSLPATLTAATPTDAPPSPVWLTGSGTLT